MNSLDTNKKEEIKQQIEYILEPIEGKVISFDQPHDIYCCIRSGYSIEDIMQEKYKVTFYPITVNTKLGELIMSIESTYLNDLKSAMGVSFAYSTFVEKNKLPNDTSLEIQKRIYS